MASLERVRIGAICTPGVHRRLDEAAIERLKQSIAAVGMLQPPVIRRIPGGQPWLISGQHRLEACRRLGLDIVECIVIEADSVGAELGTIAENLHRQELSEIERSEQTARWLDLLAERDAMKAAQVGHPSGGAQPHERGISKAARELNVSRSIVQRRVKIAGLSPEAKDAAREAGLDRNQRALLAAAEKPKIQQAGEIRRIAAERSKPKREELSPLRATLMEAWKKTTKKDRRWFLMWVQNQARA